MVRCTLILYAMFTYSETTPFPGLYALVPTLGAVLIILFATNQTTVGKFVGNKAFVGIGLVSYSAYLWHQPLFAFARHKGLNEDGNILFLQLSLVTFMFAYFSWKYVEAPFRKRGFVNRRLIFFLGLLFTFFFIYIGYLGNRDNGFESRFKLVLSGDIGQTDFHKYIDAKYYDCEPKIVAENALRWEGFLRCKQSKQGIPEIILLGDSHAEHLFLGLAEYIPSKNVAFYILDEKPYIGVDNFKPIFNEILNNKAPQHIILTMHFMERVDASGSGLYEGFSSTISALLKAGKSVTLVGDVPRFNQDAGQCVYSSPLKPKASCTLSHNNVEQQLSVYNNILERLAREYGLTYLSIYEDLCVDNLCSMSKDDAILYRDDNHLNIIGSKLVGKSLAERLPLE